MKKNLDQQVLDKSVSISYQNKGYEEQKIKLQKLPPKSQDNKLSINKILNKKIYAVPSISENTSCSG